MDVVTGSFGYIGKYITQELLTRGQKVKTITTHPDKPNPFGDQVEAVPYHFENPEKLTQYLQGCDYLFNTYWIRFNYQKWSFDKALINTQILFECAKAAGIKKVVHISVTNPLLRDELPYYRGKAMQEKALQDSGLEYAIIRPTLVFGKEDILVNNIAWTIRKFPLTPIFGSGQYRVQPIFVKDLARIAVDQALLSGSQTLDAIGPETFTYQEFLKLIASEISPNTLFLPVPPTVGVLMGKVIGFLIRDVLLTQDELTGLMGNKLTSDQAPNAETRFTDWIGENHQFLGTSYTSELKRHFHWKPTQNR
jgi:NADH dehydrogenase